jgi:hypothetical protein
MPQRKARNKNLLDPLHFNNREVIILDEYHDIKRRYFKGTLFT